jgi:plasmid replication initiation protein
MESKYAIRLYQLLQRWAFVGKKRITVDELRLRLGARELDKNGAIIKDNLPAYKNLKQKALTPAVDEINEKRDLSVSFTEEKQKGSKAITALNFRIRKKACWSAVGAKVGLLHRFIVGMFGLEV